MYRTTSPFQPYAVAAGWSSPLYTAAEPRPSCPDPPVLPAESGEMPDNVRAGRAPGKFGLGIGQKLAFPPQGWETEGKWSLPVHPHREVPVLIDNM